MDFRPRQLNTTDSIAGRASAGGVAGTEYAGLACGLLTRFVTIRWQVAQFGKGFGRRRCRYGAVSIASSLGQGPSSWQSLSQARQPPQRPETPPQRIRDTSAPLGCKARRSAGWASWARAAANAAHAASAGLPVLPASVPLRRFGAHRALVVHMCPNHGLRRPRKRL